MNTAAVFRTALLALGFGCMSAQAQPRCDCTTILDACSATVTLEDDSVSIETGHRQCARVDYLIDGVPFVALVEDGSERQSLPSRNANARVLMQSCQVCLEVAADRAPILTPVEPTAERELPRAAELSWVLAVDPQYPPSAASSGIDGFVEVSFTVTPLGRVENAVVTAAEPPGVFDEAALAAISRWRYVTDEGREPVTLSHRFEFDSEDAAAAASAPGRATAEEAIDVLIFGSASYDDGADAEGALPQPVSIVRNQCIREELSYDFGAMVETNLMNTCSEPLLVYSCAEGVARYQHRWVCQNSEDATSILVRPGDRLAGNVAMIGVPEGVRTFRYAEKLFVARPRNTPYWWLACDVDDAECRSSGRLWARSMDGKAASVDPQLWTQQSVARSY